MIPPAPIAVNKSPTPVAPKLNFFVMSAKSSDSFSFKFNDGRNNSSGNSTGNDLASTPDFDNQFKGESPLSLEFNLDLSE